MLINFGGDVDAFIKDASKRIVDLLDRCRWLCDVSLI